MIEYIRQESNIVILSINRNDQKTNLLDEKLLMDLEEKFDQALHEDQLAGIIITSAKAEFLVGADISMLTAITSQTESLQLIAKVHQLFRKIETCGFPVVAAINGTALGGGLELTLACHYRIAINDAKIKIGFPEVGLGLLPGAGGTQRLPRMIGYAKALPYLLEGKKIDPSKALEAGIVDSLVETAEQLIASAQKWIADNPQARQPWDKKDYRLPGGKVHSSLGLQVFPATTAMIKQKTYNNYPAPMAILSAVYEGLQVPFEQALIIESQYFAQLVTGKVAKNMIRTLFNGINSCNKQVENYPTVARPQIKKVGILGAGMMGAGIAYVTARAGIPLVIKDLSDEVALRGKQHVEKLLEGEFKKGKITEKRNFGFYIL